MYATRTEHQEAQRISDTIQRLGESEDGLRGVNLSMRLVDERSFAYIVMAPGHIRLAVSPTQTLALSDEQLLAVLAHEVGHYLITQGRVPTGMSRHDEEFAADEQAARIAGPQAMIDILRMGCEGDEGSDTHPSTRDRIARLELITA